VEGPSDSIICGGLANRCSISLEAGGSQLLPVIGKGQFSTVVKLFRLIGKEPLVLTDADGLADGLELANSFLSSKTADATAAIKGFGSATEMSRTIFQAFCNLVEKRWHEISAVAALHPYWANRDISDPDTEKFRRRAAFCTLFTNTDTFIAALSNDEEWLSIKKRLNTLVDVLESEECFVLRKGTIESYFVFSTVAGGSLEKPSAAASEVAAFRSAGIDVLEKGYDDVLRCLRRAASTKPIVEAESLQDIVLAIAAPALARVPSGASGDELKGIARSTVGNQANLLDLAVIDGRLEIRLNSRILDVKGFPIRVGPDDNVVKTVAAALGLTTSKSSG
jgi:hypothetical protein